MKGQKEQTFQQLLTEIGHKLQPNDVEILKKQLKLKERLPTSVLDDIDSRGRNSGPEFLKKLQEEGYLAEDNLKLLKELFQVIERDDLLEKLFEFEEKIKEYEISSEVKVAIAGETVEIIREDSPPCYNPIAAPPSIFRRVASYISNAWRSITGGPRNTPPSPRPRKGSLEAYKDICRVPSLSSKGYPLDLVCLLDAKLSTWGSYEAEAESEEFEPSYGTILHTEHVKIGVEGGFHDLSSLGVLLEIPSNAVTGPTDVKCVRFSPDFCLPTEENKTLVSCCVAFNSNSVVRPKTPIFVTLKHSGPSKKEGYETIVKAWEEPRRKNCWKQITEIQEDTPLAREHFESGFIEVEISEWTALAVVTRLITDTFEVTDKGCVVRSSVCDDVTVEFPEGAVHETYIGSMKLLMMPDHIDILYGMTAYPCPLLLIDGFEGVSFDIPVKIRLPHPYPAGYPAGNVRLLTMYTPHEWKDITDEVVYIVEDESFIEVQVNHFSWLWVWTPEFPLTVASSLYRYLFKAPQDVCFAVFKENEVCSDISLTMALVCVSNHEQFEITSIMKKEGYMKLASSTGNKKMRPDDKAYTKVEGCYKKKLKGDIFLQFIENGICRKELPLLRKSDKKEEAVNNSSRELVISLLEKKDGDVNDNLCTFYIEETRIITKLIEKECSVESYQAQNVESAPPGPPGLCSSGTVNRPIRRTTTSEAASCKELEICFGDESIAAIDTNEAASKVADFLKLDKLSLDDPPDDIMVKCRELCSYLKSNRRDDIVNQIRVELPAGMTGPLGDGSLLVKYMDLNSKQRISRALSGEDEYIWKAFAQNVGVSEVDIKYYGQRTTNPVLVILDEHCGDMTVEELYVHIVESGANAIADNHL